MRINIRVNDVDAVMKVVMKHADGLTIVATESNRSLVNKLVALVPARCRDLQVRFEDEVREPHKHEVTTRKKSVNRKLMPEYRPWSREENEQIKTWYKQPENHYQNGNMIPSKMVELGKRINRTHGAVQVRIAKLKLNRIMVRGLQQAKYANSSVQAQPTQTKFPVFKTVTKNQNLVEGMLNQFTMKKDSELKFNQAFAVTIGLNNVVDWYEFVYEVMQKSQQICDALNRKNLITIQKADNSVWLRYG